MSETMIKFLIEELTKKEAKVEELEAGNDALRATIAELSKNQRTIGLSQLPEQSEVDNEFTKKEKRNKMLREAALLVCEYGRINNF
jgi:hypothetical protein